MRTTNTILGLIRERSRKGLPLERMYRLLFNKDLYLTAYGKIYRNAGALTKGVTEETADGMSLEKIDTLIQALRSERYQWKPARRISIPKKNGKQRPLGMLVWSDKVLQEVIRSLLEAYFEPQFSEHSHGFRPERGCHTALREIYHNWHGTTWFIEGDISACFDTLDHELLMATLGESIHDGRFLNLIRKLLQAGYLEKWNFHNTYSGTPQGGIVSPILANILLDKLDKYVETILIPKYTRGTQRKANPPYKRLSSNAQNARKRGEKAKARNLRKQAQKLPSRDPQDPDYRRLKYVRYADDFLLGFVGPKSEAELIKQELTAFLRTTLKLELSESKTLITHARTEAAKFLGYEITVIQKNQKRTRRLNQAKCRSINGVIGLRIPKEVIEQRCERYQKHGTIVHRYELNNFSNFSIVDAYQSEFRGLANYYQLAYNMHALNQLKWIMEVSLTKTLARKNKISVHEVYKRHHVSIVVGKTTYKGLQVIVPREGKNPLIATWGGIPLKWDIKAAIQEHFPSRKDGRTEVEKRLLAEVCEYCGARGKVEVHHVRKLKDLTKKTGREKPPWVIRMAQLRRKTLFLCQKCHKDLHRGKPMARPQITLAEVKALQKGQASILESRVQ